MSNKDAFVVCSFVRSFVGTPQFNYHSQPTSPLQAAVFWGSSGHVALIDRYLQDWLFSALHLVCTMPGRTINRLAAPAAAEASRKRTRASDQAGDEDGEVVDVQRASSSLRAEPVSNHPVPPVHTHSINQKLGYSENECEFPTWRT